MIAIVDTGGANIGSVKNALERIGFESILTSEPSEIRAASHVILPGVGAAGDSMARMRSKNLVEVIKSLTQPVLGICLGMQLLFEASEEGDVECLGLIPGKVSRLAARAEFPVPHMGWNRVRFVGGGPLARGIESGEYYYFVHSFAAPQGMATTGQVDYGGLFPAMVNHENFHGVQFHPERSAAAGSRLLRNFVSL